MAEHDDNELDKAVEQVDIDESGATTETPAQRDQKEQTSTTTNTAATGTESLEAQVVEADLDESAGAEGTQNADSASSSDSEEGSAPEPVVSTSSQSQVIEGEEEVQEASEGEAAQAESADREDVGAQSVGGGTSAESSGATPAAPQSRVAEAGLSEDAEALTEAQGDTGEYFDTSTVSDTFQVDVQGGTTQGDAFDTETTSTTFEIDVTSQNDVASVSGPVALDGTEDGALIITSDMLLANATDVDGDSLSVQNLTLTNPDFGEIIIQEDGSWLFQPAPDYNGGVNFSYDIFDGTESVPTQLIVNVAHVNDAAVVEDQSFTVEEDGSITITDQQLLSGATDIDGDNLSIETVTYTGTDGVFTNNGDGTYTFAPNENFNGEVDLSFDVSDGTAITTANVDITVADVNDAPVAGSTSYSVAEDGTLTFSNEQLLANSSDVDGTVSVDSIAYSGTDGVLTDNGDGSHSFAPNENFNGDVSIDVTVIDDDGATATTTAGVTVTDVNDAPVAGSTTYSVAEDGTLTISDAQLLANSSDVDGTVSVDGVAYSGTDGILTDNGDGTHSFAPNENFNGNVALDVTVVDDDGATAVTTAGIDVIAMNDVPVVSGDLSYSVNEDGSITFSQEQLLANASDLDGDGLSATNLSAGGDSTVTDNGDGTFTVTPDADFNGDIQLNFDVSDSDGATAQGGVGLTVNPVNDVAVVQDQAFTLNEDGSITITDAQLLSGASDVDGDSLSVADVSYSGTDGVFTNNGDGTYDFAPNENFNGDVGLNFSVSDGTATTDANIDLTVTDVNDTPIAGSTSYSVAEDGTLTFSNDQLLANSSDVDGTVSVDSVAYSGTDGVLTDNGDGSHSFAPNENFNGDVSIDVTVIDDDGATATTTAGVTVTDVNDAPVAGSTTYSVAEDGTLTISDAQLLANSSDVDGTVSVDGVAYSGTDGILTDNGNGTHSFAPNENFNGNVTLDVTVVDDDGATAVTTAGIDVIAMNDVPVVSGDLSYSVNEDGSITFSQEQLLANASDLDGDGLSATNLSAGGDSTVTDNGDGTFTVTPVADFNGDIQLSFDVSDGDGATAQGGVGLTVNPVNDVAVVQDQAFTLNEDGSITITDAQLLSGASDVDTGDTLSVADVSYSGTDGVFTDNGDGTYDFAPNENFNGDVGLNFSVSDGTATTDANIDLTVTDVNDVPIAGSTSYSVAEDGTLTFSNDQLLANSSDVDGTVSVDSVAYSGTDGVLTDNGDGSYSFAPNENFNGDVSIDVTVIDDDGATATTTVGVTVIDVNDAPVAGSTTYSVAEDGTLTISDAQLLANSSDVDGTVSVDGVAYSGTDGILTNNGDGTHSFAPNENFNGNVSLDVTVVDDDGATATTTVGIDVIAVNDTPVVSGDLAYSIDEDGSIIFSQDQLLVNASDLDGDDLSATNMSADNSTVTDNGDGTFTITPDANFNGDIALSFDVSDGAGGLVQGGVGLTVNPINDPVIATDDSSTSSLRPMIRLDAETDYGSMQYQNAEGEWVDMEVGVEYAADTEIQFLPDTDNIQIITSDTQIGTFDGSASTSDWGTVNGTEAVFTQGDLTVTTSSSSGDLTSYNSGGTATGVGIGDNDSDGLSQGEVLKVAIDGEDINQISFTLDGLGGFFDENSSQATQVQISAFDADGNLIDSQGGYRESGEYSDTYSFTADVPVAHFELTTSGGDGNYVVQNMTVSRTASDEVQMTTIQADGTETVNVAHLNLTNAESGSAIDLTEQLITVDGSIEEIPFSVEEDGSMTITAGELLVNDYDVDGDSLSITEVNATDDTHGTVAIDENGVITFSPDANYNGEASFSYTVTDGNGSTDVATVTVQVEAQNDGPVASNQNFSMNEDGSITITDAQLLTGSSDLDGDTLNVTDVSYSGTDGVFTDNGDGTYDFSPNENFNGDVGLNFSVSDGTATTDANIDLTVTDVNDTPVAGSTTYSVSEDGTLTISDAQLLANSSDVDGSVSVDSVAYSGTDGILTDNGDGTHSFAPNENFNGNVSLDVTVVDDDGATDVTTAGIDVIAVNDTPVVSGDLAYSVNEDGSITFSQEQLLANASDVDGDDLSATNLSAGGDSTVTDNGDGSFTVTPDADFNGDIQLSFDVSDSDGATAQAGVGLTVNPVNDVAVVQNQAFTLNEDGSITITDEQLLSGASDVDGDNLSVADVSYSGTDGVFTDNGDGTYDFAPNENFNGDVGLNFSVSDGTATTDANINLTVTDVNDTPVAGSTTYSVAEDGTLTISDAQLLANSSDVDGSVSVDSVAYSGTDGILTNNGDGTHSFAPNENFNGDVSLDVTITDDDGATDTTTAGIDVIAVNDTPVVSGDLAYSVAEDGSITFSQDQLLANASDVDGDDLSATNLSAGGDSTVTDNGDGTFTVTPDADFNGDIQLSFDVSDSDGATAQAGVGLTVNPVNDVAVVQDQAFTLNEDGSITITDAQLLSGASDIDAGDTLSVADVSYSGTDGVFTDNGDGTYDFAPNENFNGDVGLNFTVGDGTAITDANIDLTVTDVNDAPVAGSTTYSVAEDGTLTISDAQLLANSSDVDGSVSVDSVAYSGTDGILTDNGDGTHSFAPNENFNGNVSLDVTVVDDDGATDVTTAGIDVIAVNDTPVVSGDLAYSVDEDGSITFSQEQLLANASDVDSESLSATNLSAGGDSTVTDNGDGTFTVTPNADFNGDIQLSFDVSDGLETVAAGVGLTVNPVNDVAVVQDQAFTLNEDGSITITDAQLLSGASDVDGDNLSVADVSYTGTDGVFTDNGDGTYDFAPNENFNGDISGGDLSFSVSDGTATTDANIDLTVTDVNDAPVAGSTTYSMQEDGSLTFNDAQLLANSSDVDGILTVDSITYTGSDGILTDNGDGTYRFAPNEHFNGDVSIDVTVIDDDGASETTTASVDVIAVNDAPVVSGDLAYSVDEDGSITFSQEQLLANSSDIEGDNLSAMNLSADNASIISNADGSFTVNPDANFNGDINLSFQVSDGTDTTITAVELTVNPVNDAPIIGSGIEDATLNAGSDWVMVGDAQISNGEGILVENAYNQGGAMLYDHGFESDDGIRTSFDFQVDPEGGTGYRVGDGMAVSFHDGSQLDASNFEIGGLGGGLGAINLSTDFLTIGFDAYTHDWVEIRGSNDQLITKVDVASYGGIDHETDSRSVEIEMTQDGLLNINMSFDGGNSFISIIDGMDMAANGIEIPDTVKMMYSGSTGGAKAEMTIANVEVASIAGTQQSTTAEDSSYIISEDDLLVNASDIENSDLSVIGFELVDPDSGLIIDNGDGTWTFEPADNFNGEVEFSYSVSDGELSTSAPNYVVVVEDVNDVAVVQDQAFTLDEDGVITITDEQLLAGATDIDGDSLSIESVNYTGTDGVFTDNGDGTYDFAPNENFNGDISGGDLSFSVSDGTATTDANIDLTVTDVNDAPVAGSTTYSVAEDGTLTISDAQLLANSSDVDGTVSVDGVAYSGTDGILTDNGDGTHSFAPNENFNGNVSLDVTVVDDDGATAVTTAGIDVIAMNDVPVVSGDLSYSVNEDGSITFSQEQLLANASDLDGDGLSATNLSAGGDSTVTDNGDGTFTVTPDADFNGDIQLSFDVSDSNGGTVQGGVGLTVNPVNDVAVVQDQAFTLSEDGSITITDAQLLSGASDVDGDNLSVADVSYSGTDGVFTDNGDGTYDFAPNENFNGDVGLNFSVSDGTATTDANINLTVADVNDAPIAGSTSYSVAEDGTLTFSDAQLLANSSDVDGTVSVDSVAYSGTDGVLTDNGDGTHSFAPNENFNGDVSIDVTVIDDDGATASTTAGVTVADVNDAPVAGSTTYSVSEDGTLTITDAQLLANSSDVDGTVSVDGVAYSGTDGILTDNGNGTHSFAPNENFNGNVTLDVTVVDDDGATDVTTAGIDVIAMNDTPVVSGNLAYSVDEDGSITFSQEQLLANASDVDGDALSASLTSAENATLTDNGDGSYTITPDENYHGELNFSMDISDGTEVVQSGLDVTVNSINDGPVATDDGTTEGTLQLDGGDYVNIHAGSNSGEQITSFWFKSDSDEPQGLFSVTSGANSGQHDRNIWIDDEGNVKARVWPGEEILESNVGDLSDGEWHHIVYSLGGSEGSALYIDGAVNDTGTVGVSGFTSSSQMHIGHVGIEGHALFDGSSTFDGEVRDFQVYTNVGADQADVDSLMAGDELGHDLLVRMDFSADDVFGDDSDNDIRITTVGNPVVVDQVTGDLVAAEDIVTYFDVLANDSDIDNDTLSITGLSEVTDADGNVVGTVSIVSIDGEDQVQFMPSSSVQSLDEGDELTASFTYTISDGEGSTDTATVAFNIEGSNDSPVVSENVSASIAEDGSITFTQSDLLSNVEDIDGDSLSASNVSVNGDATVVDNGNGTFTVTPSADFNGNIELSFDVTDRTDIVSASLDLTVTPTNDAPIVNHVSYTAEEDGSLTFTNGQLLGVATDIDSGDMLSVVSVSYSGSDGVFSNNGDGSYSFSPNENFHGDVALDFSVTDGTVTTASNVDMTFTAVNDAPVAGTTSYTAQEDGILTFSDAQLLANSSDVDSEHVVDSVTYAGADGILTSNGDGTYDFAPNDNFNGDLSFDVVISDGELSDTTIADISIIAVNDEPVVSGDLAYSVDEDGAITFSQEQLLANASDVDGDALSAENLSAGNATVTDNGDGSYTVTPDADFNGDIQISFDVSDGAGGVVQGGVGLTVNPVNDVAVVSDHAIDVNEDGTITITDAQLLAGATDIDGDTLAIDSVNYSGTDGVFTDNGDGTYDFAPNENFNGDVGLNFSVSDGTATTDANIDLTVTDVNDAPIAGSTSYSVAEDGTLTFSDAQLLANSSDVDGTVSVDSVAYPGTDGVLTDNGDGTHSFAPNENFNGDVSIDVTVIDDDGATASTTAGVTVADVNDAPVAGSTSYSVSEDGTLTISDAQLLANSSDVDGTVSVDGVAYSGTDGILTDNGDGTHSFAPNENFNGNVTLDVTVVDDDGATDVTTAGIDVIAMNDTPVVSGDLAYSVNEDGSITFSQEQLLANASDIDGDSLSATNLSAGGNSTVKDNGDGTFTVTPDADFNGDIQLSFDVNDSDGATAQGGVGLTVNPVNDVAVLGTTDLSGTEDNTITITQSDLLANASDIDGDTLTASNLNIDSSFGEVVDNGDGTFSFTPAGDYNGDVPFSFAVSDGTASTTAHGNIDIAAVNDIPVFSEASFATTEDNSIIIDSATLLANASDVDGDTLSISSISAADGNGTVTENEDGNWVFTPSENFSGDAQLNITISDGNDTAIFDSTVAIDAQADAPALNVSLDTVSVSEFTDASISGGRLSGWSTDNSGGAIEVYQDYVYGVGDNRGAVLELERNPGDESNVYQNLDISAGETITLSFDISARVGTSGEDAQVDLYFDGVLIDSIQPGVGWESHSYTLTATSDSPRLELDSPSHNGVGSVLDVITVSEPIGISEDTIITVNIDAALVDTDGSESMQSLTVDDIPEGAILSDGNNEFVATNDSSAVDVVGWDLSSLTITPPDNFNGELSLEVTAVSVEASNGDTSSTTQTLSIDVQAANDAVVIDIDSPLAFNATEDTAFTITEAALLGNASDVDGDDLIVTNLTIPNASYVTVVDAETGDKSFIVTPNENFNGDVDISFNVSDQEGSIVESGASLSVAAVNDVAVVQDQAFTLNEDGSITITDAQLLSGASDVDSGATLSVADVSYSGTDGVFTDNGDGTYDFAPNENFNGDISGGDLSFSVSDGTVTTDANIDLTVVDVNDAPIAGSTSYSVAEDGTLTFSDAQVLANSSDVDGTVSVDSVAYSGTDGVLTDNGDGTHSFAPNENFNGDVSIDVIVVDDDGATATTTAGVTVTDVNDAPVAGSTTYSVAEDGTLTISDAQLLANSSDVDGTVSVDGVAYSGTDGILTDNGDGTHSFAPNENFNGNVTLDVTVVDDDGATAVTTAGVDVIAMNDVPVVSGDLSYSVNEDGSITFSQEQLLTNASDLDGDDLSATNLSAGGDSTVTDNGDGTFTVTPDADFNGDIQLSFDVSDSDGATAQGGVGLTVNPVNDVAVVSAPIELNTDEDTSIIITQAQLLENASDVDGDSLIAENLTLAGGNGTVTDNGNGTWTVEPDANFNGDLNFTYDVNDGTGSTPATLDVTIDAINDGPVTGDVDAINVEEDGTIDIDPALILAQASDLDGDDLSLSSLTLRDESQGSLNYNTNTGMYNFSPAANFAGAVALDYVVSDGLAEATGSMEVNVTPVNDAAFQDGNASMTTMEDGAITFKADDLLNLFGDIDGDTLTISNVITPEGEAAEGAVVDNGDGTWTFTPTDDFAGTTELQIVVSDGTTETTMDMPVYVRPVADGAVITSSHEGPLVFDEDSSGLLSLDVSLLDDSEVVSNLVMSGYPVGFTISDGEHTVTITEEGQMIQINDWDISALQMTPPENWNGSFEVTVTATTVDYGDEISTGLPDSTEVSGDFDTTAGQDITLSAADLMGMAENTEAQEGDEVTLVHLIDDTQGTMVDNGDGTWTFSPAEGFSGAVDFAYVVARGEEFIDEQGSIAVLPDAAADEGQNTAPEVDSITTTDMDHDNILNFTDADLLEQISDSEGDALSIEGVQITNGQGVLLNHEDGSYSFKPEPGYTGEVQIGFGATDGTQSIESHMNVTVNENSAPTIVISESPTFMVDEDESITFSQSEMLSAVSAADIDGDTLGVQNVDIQEDAGTIIDNGDGSWTYWPDPDFSGEVQVSFDVNDGSVQVPSKFNINVVQTNNDVTEEGAVSETADTEASNNAAIVEELDVDYTVAPGGTLSLSIPDEIANHEDVDHVVIYDLPEGATSNSGLEDADGNYVISGDLSQPIIINLGSEFEGDVTINMTGNDVLDTPVEGAEESFVVDIDDTYSMQGSSADHAGPEAIREGENSDWTTADNTNTGVDVMDDSASYDQSNDQGVPDQPGEDYSGF